MRIGKREKRVLGCVRIKGQPFAQRAEIVFVLQLGELLATGPLRHATGSLWVGEKVYNGVANQSVLSFHPQRTSELQNLGNVTRNLAEKERFDMSLETLTNAARVPVNLLLMVVLLPMLVVEYVLSGLTLLVSIGSLLQCEDRGLALKFLTAYQSGALLKAKFPNSIAVRS